jgi:hypothetical protein
MVVWIGYLASLFLAISLVVKTTLKFRWFSTAGQIAFIVYGICIGAFPVIIANSVLFCINIFQLIKLYRYQEKFHLVPVTSSNAIVQEFLRFNEADVATYFPAASFKDDENKIAFVVLRDMVIANLFVANLLENGIAKVEINYTIPSFRDFKVGRFIFDREKAYLLQQGVQQVVYERVHNESHLIFLKQMGFAQTTMDGKNYWAKSLT